MGGKRLDSPWVENVLTRHGAGSDAVAQSPSSFIVRRSSLGEIGAANGDVVPERGAGLRGFRDLADHYSLVRDCWRRPETSPAWSGNSRTAGVATSAVSTTMDWVDVVSCQHRFLVCRYGNQGGASRTDPPPAGVRPCVGGSEVGLVLRPSLARFARRLADARR